MFFKFSISSHSSVMYSFYLLPFYAWEYCYFLPLCIYTRDINFLLETKINQLDIKFTKTTLIKLGKIITNSLDWWINIIHFSVVSRSSIYIVSTPQILTEE